MRSHATSFHAFEHFCQVIRRRGEFYRLVRNSKNIIDLLNIYRYTCCHTRQKLKIRVRSIYDNSVGDNIGCGGRLQPDLADAPCELLIRVSINGKLYTLPNLYLPYICLINIGLNLHLCKILRNGKNLRSTET